MRMRRCLGTAGLLVLLIVAGSRPRAPALAQDIVLVPKAGPHGTQDFWSLFQPDAQWKNAAQHLQVVAVPSTGFPDDDLRRMFADLERRHIGAELDMLPLSGANSASSVHCGYHIEGYSAPGETALIARHVKALGAAPVVYGMDEPLFYGHYYSGPNACRSSISDIARDVATKIRQVREIFPGIEITEAEPLMGLPDATWLHDLAQWFDEYQAATGTRLSCFWLDLDWHGQWQRRLPRLVALLHQKGVGLGVIYNGDDTATSDEAWIASAVAHYETFEKALGHSPDAVSFQTWVSHPTHALPESDPRTLTSLVNRYVAWKASRH